MAYVRIRLPEDIADDGIKPFMARVTQSFDSSARNTDGKARILGYHVDDSADAEGTVVCARVKGDMTSNQAGVLSNYKCR